MAGETLTLLLTRPDDLVVLGVRLKNFAAQADGSETRAVAQPGARLHLVFPPQSLLEPGFDGQALPLTARFSTPSLIEFQINAGMVIPLDVQGLLAALSSAPILPTHDLAGDLRTVLDLPWGVRSTVLSASSEAEVLSDHPSAAVRSLSGIVGLWTSRLTSTDGVKLAVLGARPDDPALAGQTPLSAPIRQQIADEIKLSGPPAAQISLSALGASLNVRFDTARFGWEHETSLGRDERVAVLSQGMLYPFGHRAVLVETAVRQIDADPPLAGLRREMRIIITEPIRFVDRRDFPFSSVEIIEDCVFFEKHGDPQLRDLGHPETPLDAQRAELSAERDALAASLNAQLQETVPVDIFDMAAKGIPEAPDLMALRDAINSLAAEIGAVNELIASIQPQIDVIQAQLDNLPIGPVGPDGDPATDQLRAELEAQIDALRAEKPSTVGLPAMRKQFDQKQAEERAMAIRVDQQFASIPRTIEALRDAGDPGALRFVDLTAQIDEVTQQINAIIAQILRPREVSFQPQTADGTPIQFNLKFAGSNRTIDSRLPLIFVHDFEMAADSHFPLFKSLSDRRTIDALETTWARQGGGKVALPGVALDLVRSAAPLPGDIHEVHGIDIAAVREFVDAYLPLLKQIDVKLPSLRTMLPGKDELISLVYNEVESEIAPLLPIAPIAIDFTKEALRSGGLVSPRYAADAISRTLGPVPIATLGEAVPDLANLYDGATLLGFQLGELIKPIVDGIVKPPNPPKIVPLIENGQPVGARLEWDRLPLQSRGMFVAGESSHLHVEVEYSATSTKTICDLHDFALALPEGHELVRLDFKTLSLTQEANRPPNIKVDGIKLSFSGELNLLDKLQAAVQEFLGLGDGGPRVHATTNGVSASYALVLPEVSSGMFVMRNIAFDMTVDVPFNADPVTVRLGFARSDSPFNLAVMAFGGGGFIAIELTKGGLKRLDLSLEFGAFVAVNLVVASGEVHVAGGLHLAINQGAISIQAYVRLGGSVEVLGLISVSIELRLALTYESTDNRLIGRAALVVEIDVLFLSKSVELDSGEWVFSGPSREERTRRMLTLRAAGPDAGREDWNAYREAFAA
jgi:hypothetical protein